MERPTVDELRGASVFDGVSDEFLLELAGNSESRSIGKTETLIEEGSAPDEFSVILEGEFLVQMKTAGEGHRILARVGKNDVVGEIAVFDRSPRSATVVALTDGRVAAIPSQALDGAIERHPTDGHRFYQNVIVDLAAKMRSANEKLRNQSLWYTAS